MAFAKLTKRILPTVKTPLVDPQGRRLIGLTTETRQPIWAPKGHSLLLSANGGGKTTNGAMTWLLSLLASMDPNDPQRAICVMDSKDGELAAQCADMIAGLGLKAAIIDDMGVFPADSLHRVTLNPLGSVTETYRQEKSDVVFATDSVNHALVPEPTDDAKNAYFRDEPRTLIEFATHVLLKRNPKLAVPGGVWALLGDPKKLRTFAQIEAEEAGGDGDPMLRVLALNVLEMMSHEHWGQHRSAAIKALRIFGVGTRLHNCGTGATLTHADLIRQGTVIFLVGPQAHIARLGAYYALHILAFNHALYQGAGKLTQILDEFTNAPLKPLVEGLTTLRAYGAEFHMIAQSRSEIERKFGKLECETIEENAIVKQYFGFSSFAEAERISKAIGEEQVHSQSLSSDDASLRLQTSYQAGKELSRSPAQLMAMPTDTQLIHLKGIGFIEARKIGQQNIAPYCHQLGDNPLEGARFEPDPWITLKTRQKH